MIEVHHLNNSRSQRILWLLEELGLDYKIVPYQPRPATPAGAAGAEGHPPARQVAGDPRWRHGRRRVGRHRRVPGRQVRQRAARRRPRDFNSPDYVAYLHWLHFAEGSAMLPLLLEALCRAGCKEAGAPLLAPHRRAS